MHIRVNFNSKHKTDLINETTYNIVYHKTPMPNITPIR